MECLHAFSTMPTDCVIVLGGPEWVTRLQVRLSVCAQCVCMVLLERVCGDVSGSRVYCTLAQIPLKLCWQTKATKVSVGSHIA